MEVDWTVLFSSFFATVRIKIKCKNPAKVPMERVYEMGDCYLISFKTKGVEQLADPTNKDDDGGKGDDGKCDDRVMKTWMMMIS